MKKTLLIVVSLVLVAALAVGVTVAYFTSETDTAVNVMVVGDIEIAQNEQERVDDNVNQHELQDYTQGKPLWPAFYEGTSIPWAPADEWVNADDQAWKVVADNAAVIDKFVTVENTGDDAAYVRTVFAFEVGDVEDYTHLVTNSTNIVGEPTWEWEFIDNFEMGGNTYLLAVATYTESLASGVETIPSLKQVYLDKRATQEECASLGDTYEILAMSQAVQVVGFENPYEALNEAFGEITLDNHPWVNGLVTKADGADELLATLENAMAGQTVELAAGDYGYINIDFAVANNVTIVADAETDIRINFGSNAVANGLTVSKLDVVHYDNTSGYVDGGVVTIDAGAKVDITLSDCVVEASGGRSCFVGVSEPNANITIDNCTVSGSKYLVYGSAPIDKLTIVNSDFSNISSWVVMLNAGDGVGANLTIDNNTLANCNGGIAKYLGSTQPEGASTVFTNNTLENCNGHDGKDTQWFTIPGATSTVTVSGNTLDGADWTPGTAQGLGK